MTKGEYEARWAIENGLLLPQVSMMGLEAVPCGCGDPACPGWRMASTAEHHQRRATQFVDRNLLGFEDYEKC